jgi:TRAP-type C4-dicarboxylate transport system permease small subunit
MQDQSPDAASSASVTARGWGLVVDGLAALGTALIGVLMLIICADVLARNLVGGSLPLVSELGALTLVMIVYLQLGATVRAGRLARADIFFHGFRQRRPRAGAALAAVFEAVGAVAVGGIAWATVSILQKDIGSREYIGVTGIATLPTWPFRALILAGAAVAAVQFVLRMVEALREAGGAKPR